MGRILLLPSLALFCRFGGTEEDDEEEEESTSSDDSDTENGTDMDSSQQSQSGQNFMEKSQRASQRKNEGTGKSNSHNTSKVPQASQPLQSQKRTSQAKPITPRPSQSDMGNNTINGTGNHKPPLAPLSRSLGAAGLARTLGTVSSAMNPSEVQDATVSRADEDKTSTDDEEEIPTFKAFKARRMEATTRSGSCRTVTSNPVIDLDD